MARSMINGKASLSATDANENEERPETGPALLATALIAIHASGAYAAVQKTKLRLFPLLPP